MLGACTSSTALQKFSPSLNFHMLSRYSNKCKCILLGIHVIDQQKKWHIILMRWKYYMVFIIIYKQESEKVLSSYVFTPFMVKLLSKIQCNQLSSRHN